MIKRVMCNSCGGVWDYAYIQRCLRCKRDLRPMRNVTITVSDEADLDMFRKINNETDTEQ